MTDGQFAFLGAVTVAAATGLAIIAYRHPEGYRRLYILLTAAMFSAFILGMVWDFGVRYGFDISKPFVEPSKAPEAMAAEIAATVVTGPVMAGWVGAVLYLSFLWNMPGLIGKEPSKGGD